MLQGLCLESALEARHHNAEEALQMHAHVDWTKASQLESMGYAPDAAAQARAGYAADFVPLMCGEIPYRRIHRELPAALIGLARALS